MMLHFVLFNNNKNVLVTANKLDTAVEVLDKMRMAIRKHKRSAPIDKIPPKAKSPLEYINEGMKMNHKKK